MPITNLFIDQNITEVQENIKSFGAKGIYTPGLHDIVDTEIFLYETEWQGTTYTNASIVFTNAEGATLTEDLKTSPNKNQTAATTNFLSYLASIAIVTDKIEGLEGLKAAFGALPPVTYKDPYKNEHKAKSIKLFANTPYTILTYSELSGDANGIFTNQRVNLQQLFRATDGASVAEIKDKKEDVGASKTYWADPAIHTAKAQIKYHKDGRWADDAVLGAVLDHLQSGGTMSKDQRDKITAHWDANFAKSVLKGAVEAPKGADIDEAANDEEEVPFAF